ncbi:MAG: cytidylate kinase family protein [Candidatus Beckwithbacteria bacterium]|nr:cytidylate kinase family protein [Candidatus Beckwithbacteria bacterium]
MKFKNVTISGRVCTGTSTLSQLLTEKIGWRHWNAGQFFRDYCRENNLSLENASDRSDDLARKVDLEMRQNLQTKQKQIMEAWLSGFVAQGVEGVLKVLLVCDDSLRIDRLVNRDGMTVEKAKVRIKQREQENAKKWTRVYQKEWRLWLPQDKQKLKTPEGFFDFWHPALYDLVIDTYSNSKEETLKKVMEALC